MTVTVWCKDDIDPGAVWRPIVTFWEHHSTLPYKWAREFIKDHLGEDDGVEIRAGGPLDPHVNTIWRGEPITPQRDLPL